MLFKKMDIKDKIYSDIESEKLELILETDKDVHVYDLTKDKRIRFRFEEFIDQEWLEHRIFINPKLKHKFDITPCRIASILLENLPTEYFMTLERLFVIYNQSDLNVIDKELYNNLGINSDVNFIWGKTAGAMIFEKNTVIINMRYIEKVCNELNYDRINIKLNMCSTLFHEFRHLMIDTNMYLPRDIYPEYLASEEEVEKFGNDTLDCMIKRMGL